MRKQPYGRIRGTGHSRTRHSRLTATPKAASIIARRDRARFTISPRSES